MKYVPLVDIVNKPISGEWGDSEGSIKVIRTTNFTNNGVLDLTDLVERSIDPKKIAQKRLEYGDTIIEKSGGSPNQPVGRVVYFDQENDVFLCNNFTSVIRAKSDIDKRYLFWFLFNNHLTKQTLKYQNKTTGIINLQLERYVEELQIPLPPQPIQKRIAEILDTADALCRKDEALLKKYDELAQAIFIDMFGDPVKNEKGWEIFPIKSVCTDIVDCVNRTAPIVDYQTPYKMIRTTNVRNSKINLKEVRCVEKSIYENWVRRLVPQKGDIVFTREAPVGEAGIIESDDKVFLGQRTMLYRPDLTKIKPKFLLFQLCSFAVQNQISKLGSGSTVKHLSVPDCKEFLIHCPPLVIQTKFEEQINSILKQNELVDSLSSNNLFNSLLQKAFNGELVK